MLLLASVPPKSATRGAITMNYVTKRLGVPMGASTIMLREPEGAGYHAHVCKKYQAWFQIIITMNLYKYSAFNFIIF